MKILVRKRSNNQNMSIENGSQDYIEKLLNNPSYFKLADGINYDKILDDLHKLKNNPLSRKTVFEKELGSALEDYESAMNAQDEKLRNKAYESALEHAKKAKAEKDCDWPYDDLLDSIIGDIQSIIDEKEQTLYSSRVHSSS